MRAAFTLIYLFISVFVFAQNTKHQDVQKLIQLIQIKPTMQNIVEQGIIYYQKQKPAVPKEVWKDIENSINYQPYLSRTEHIFNENYTQAEIKILIDEAKANPNKPPLFKNIVQQQLYDAGKEFGKNYGNLITQTLKSKGY